MAFTASKKRERRAAEPVGRGSAIIPSAAIEAWYRAKLTVMVKAMLAEYKEVVTAEVKSEKGKQFYATDAMFSDVFASTLKSLQQRWARIFEGFASKLAPEYVEKVDGQATSATLHSLSVAGVKAPIATYNAAVANTLKASVDYNHTLITGLADEVHEKVYSAVMLSLTSPNPEEQGQNGIKEALKKAGIDSEKRVDLIVRDQTSKIYSSLSDERMKQNGCEEFEWAHSSAGKVPRHTHVEKDGQIFKLNDPRLWDGPKGDQGPPGWAINCRCRKIPIFR
jgi:SPP1 gp7 family putative phage head morphogenesis protein